jgi:hypothetical protein
MQKVAFADPFLLVDDGAVHDRDLTGWAAAPRYDCAGGVQLWVSPWRSRHQA